MPNVEVKLNTKFESFILGTDEDNGQVKVVGIEVSHDDRSQEVLCKKGVVLASGGFSADIPFRSVSVALLLTYRVPDSCEYSNLIFHFS